MNHDPLCPTDQNLDPDCWFCGLIAKVRADERAERGLANEPQGLALAQMLLHASRATEAKVRADLRAKVLALPGAYIAAGVWEHPPITHDIDNWDGKPVVLRDDVLALIDGSES